MLPMLLNLWLKVYKKQINIKKNPVQISYKTLDKFLLKKYFYIKFNTNFHINIHYRFFCMKITFICTYVYQP